MATLLILRSTASQEDWAVQGVMQDEELIGAGIVSQFERMSAEAFILSRMPPIQGLLRSTAHGGIDPLDHSTSDQWRERLETISKAVMNDRPIYNAIEYIDIRGAPRMLAGVRSGAHGPVSASGQHLRDPDYASIIERSQSWQLQRPMLWLAEEGSYPGQAGTATGNRLLLFMQVSDENGEPAGLLVMSADYVKMLGQTLTSMHYQWPFVVSDRFGARIAFDPVTGTATSLTALVSESASQRPEFRQGPGNSIGSSSGLARTHSLPLANFLEDPGISITIRTPTEQLYADAWKVGLTSIYWSLAVAAVSLIIAAWQGRNLMRPLTEITRAVQDAEKGQRPLQLNLDRRDEIGTLANALQHLHDNIRTKEAQVSAIIDKVVDAIITIDPRGTILTYNPAAEANFGYTQEEAIGRNIKLLMPPDIASQHDGYLEAYRRTGQRHIIGVTRELEAQRKDGTTFPMELSVSQIDMGEGKHVFTGIIRDITERKQMEVMQNEFVSTVNHELRTPLASIRASLGILQKRVSGKLDEKSERLVDLSLQGCTRLGQLVNDILDIEKIAAGKMDFHIQPCEIAELTNSVIERHEGIAEMYGVTFETHIDCDGVYCAVDSSRFNQALVNLLSNAAKFSPAGESVRIDLTVAEDGRIVISVADKGPGIPESFHSKIFERFAQADGSATRKKGGSGLGLNITKSIIEAFGGEVTFESAEGRGATFFFSLPACAPPQEKDDAPCKAA